jgi:hypothetical protein
VVSSVTSRIDGLGPAEAVATVAGCSRFPQENVNTSSRAAIRIRAVEVIADVLTRCVSGVNALACSNRHILS